MASPAPADRPLPSTEEWFELFFDLVFAVAVGIWAERLAHDATPGSYARSVELLLAIWWVWLGQTVFAARFPADGRAARLLAMVEVMAVGVMAADLAAGTAASLRFPLAFVTARLALLAQYALVRGTSAEARGIARAYLAGFGSGAALWALSALADAAYRPAVWLGGLAVDLAVPWVARPVLGRMPLHHRRVPVRVGAFTSLLLYLSIESIVRGFGASGWSAWTTGVGGLSFALVSTAWAIYARVNGEDMSAELGSGQPYLYAHFLVVLGAGTLSLGVRLAIEAGGPGEDAIRATAFVSAGLLLWLVGLVLIRSLVLHHRDRFWFWPFVAAAACVPLAGLVGARRLPVGTFAVFVAMLVMLLVMEIRHGRPHPGRAHRL
ncbi:MAG TPA: low temperature requirement protein A [Anaeromyxobacter sp.]